MAHCPVHCDLTPSTGEATELAAVDTKDTGLISELGVPGERGPEDAVESCDPLVLNPKFSGRGGGLLLEPAVIAGPLCCTAFVAGVGGGVGVLAIWSSACRTICSHIRRPSLHLFEN